MISARLTNAAVAPAAAGLGSAMVTVMGALASIAMAVNLHKSLGLFMGCSPLVQRRSVGLWPRRMPLRATDLACRRYSCSSERPGLCRSSELRSHFRWSGPTHRIAAAIHPTLLVKSLETHSSWDYRGVMDQVAGNADACVGAEVGAGLYIDESAFQKKGDKSVGVGRQWNGRLGKHENSQVGVFGALGQGDRVSLIDARLYLPQEWTEDAARCEEPCVPRAQQVHQTKL